MTYPNLFSPLTVGPMTVKNRLVLTPHGHVVSSLWGTDAEAEGHIAYWKARTSAGWIDGVSAHIRNSLVPGFEPTGVGATISGHFRAPFFVDRVGRLAEALHADDTRLTVQMIMQGGMPHGPSPVLSGPVINLVPHPLTLDEIDYFVEEYRFSASQVRLAGADGVELHLNHDDLLEWFVSPLTNHRTDEYGGSLENRLRFPLRILQAVREAVGRDMVVGVRFNLREEEPGGYTVDDAVAIAQRLEASGLIDYLSLTVGSPWGNPSYIQSHHHQPGEWAPLAGKIRQALRIPVVYTGRVTSAALAEQILADGHADLVGMARAYLADGQLLTKVREGREDEVRPCVGGNECISRRLVENLGFSCAVNPEAARERLGGLRRTEQPRRVLVVGGGPAGMEVAGLAAERGHDVELWESSDHLGGQLALATRAPRYDDYAAYLAWQERRLRRVGVRVVLNRRGTADAVQDYGADVVIVATGGRPRRPGIPGETLPHVHLAHDVLAQDMTLTGNVVLVAQDDHLAPLSVADFLAERGAEVTVVYGSASPAPLVSRYLLGSILGRLDARGVQMRFNEQVTEIGTDYVQVRHVYSNRTRTIDTVDAVVLACGAVPENSLYAELVQRGVEAHILGDAYAPRRLVWATRQAYDLAATL
ncbi:MAG TPA: FAD-dependent oxidoreductase [Micromonospora sp.]